VGRMVITPIVRLELMLALERWSWESSDSPPRDWIPLQLSYEGHVNALMSSMYLTTASTLGFGCPWTDWLIGSKPPYLLARVGRVNAS